ncbi:MAG: hypothetical protein K2Z81_06560, partial [Cyanobacteria bacterium]|nr:hypothetical protein [Cyanobacteriota bacterium]
GKVEKDAQGRLVRFTSNEDGLKCEFGYDAKGRLNNFTRIEKDGTLLTAESIKYKDENLQRTTRVVDFRMEKPESRETTEIFRPDGTLQSIVERGSDFTSSSDFDEKGREYNTHFRDDARNRDLHVSRLFQDNGDIVVTQKNEDANGTEEVKGTYDEFGKAVLPEVTVDTAPDGQERVVVRISDEDGRSVRVMDGGLLSRQVSIKGSLQTGYEFSETKFDALGNPEQVVDAKAYPRNPHLPTKITVTNADGTPKESIEIKYAEVKPGQLKLFGGTPVIESFTRRTPDSDSVTKEYKSPKETGKAWNELWKVTKPLELKGISIGTWAEVGSTQNLTKEDVIGRTPEDFKYVPRLGYGPA